MSKKIFVTLCLFGLLIAASAHGFEEEEGVLVLKDDNFDHAVAEIPYLLVKFYAPWCGHCKALAPEYEKAAKSLRETMPNVRLAKVDATTEKKIAEKVNIEGYPTLKFYINQNPITFNGDRTEEGIIQWIKKKTGPASNLIETAEALDKILSDNELVVVYFGSDAAEQAVFETLAQTEDELVFAHTNSAPLRLHYKVQDNVKLVLFKKFDEGRNDFTGDFTAENIAPFLRAHELPTIMPFNQKSADKIFSTNQNCLFLFIKSKDAECCKAPQAALTEAANTLKGKILLSYAELSEDLGNRLAEYVGVTEADLPCVRIVSPSDDDVKKYLYTGDISAQGLVNFYEQFSKGELKPFFKSEPLPETNDQPVKVVVGGNFKNIVHDTTKDVLVKYYAPWCGHCKSLAPIYDKIAERILHNSNIVLAKCDATANEIEGVNIQGFPTIKFYPSNNKNEPMDFDGERTEEGILEFLKNYTT